MFKNKKFGMPLLLLIIAIICCTAFVACEEKGFSVTFMDGETVLNTVTVEKGGDLNLPANPTKTGYTFVGWYLDKNFTQAYDSEVSTITADFTLYAKFEQSVMYISVVTNGGTVTINGVTESERAVVAVTKGLAYTLPTPIKEGYNFIGYTLDGEEFPLSGTYQKDNSITVRAQYELNSYSIDFYDGNELLITTNVNHGGKIAYTGDSGKLSKKGYTFKGWYKDSALTTAFDSATETANASIDLYAKFTANSYVITVNNDNGSENGTVNVVYNGQYTLTEPTKEGYTFAGYTLDGANFASNGTYVIDNNVTVKATWTINTYNVTIDGAKQDVVYGQKVVLPTPEDGYEFGGLFTDAEFETPFDKDTLVNSDLTLFAKYNAKTFTITINLVRNDATVVGGTSVSVIYGESYELNEATTTNENYEFVNYTYNGAEFDLEGTYDIADDIIIIANWDTVPGYFNLTVTFINNGITVKSVEIEREDATATLFDINEKPENPTKEGYTFLYWATSASAGEFDFTQGLTKDVTLEAQFEANAYTITINNNDGSQSGTAEVVYGQNYALTAPQKAGHEFVKYTYVCDNDALITGDFDLSGKYSIADDITITAEWDKNVYTVIFNVEGEEDEVEVYYYDTVSKPATDPEKLGHTFGGWYKDQTFNTEYDFDAPVENGFTLYAKFTANTYYINIELGRNDADVANGTSVPVIYGKHYDIADATTTNANWLFVKYLMSDNTDFVQSGTYLWTTDITVTAQWVSTIESDEADKYFVTNTSGGYFKERESLEDKFTYVFVVGNTYTFSSSAITNMSYTGANGLITVTEQETGKAFTADKTGIFNMTVKKEGMDAVTYDAKIVEKVMSFIGGTDYNNAWGESYNRTAFRNTEKGIMEVGKSNYIPDLVATNVNGNSLSYANAGIEIKSAVDSETNNVLSEITVEDGIITFADTLVGKTITLTFAPKYIFIADEEKVTMKINNGVNVYSNLELKAQYSNLNVSEINILRNIKAELVATDYVNNDPNTNAPKNGENYDRGYEHGVYTRLATKQGDALKLNGNFFTVDGSDLPYIDNGLDGGGDKNGWKEEAHGYVIGFVQVGIFLYYSAPKVAGDVNAGQYAMRMSRDEKYHTSSLTIDNLNIKGNNDPNKSGLIEQITVGSETCNLIKMSTSMLGIVNRGGTINMNNVTVQNTLSALFGDGLSGVSDAQHPCQWYLNDCKVFNSWQSNGYFYELNKVDMKNTYVGQCNGGAIMFDDRPWNDDYITYTQINSVFNADANCVFENFVTGAEAWFVAYNQAETASFMKTALEAQVNNVDTLVNAQANGMMGSTDVTYLDKSIVYQRNSEQIGGGTIEAMNFVLIVRSAGSETPSTDWTYEPNKNDTAYDMSGMPAVDHNLTTYYNLDGTLGSTASNFMPFIYPMDINESTDFNSIMQGIMLGYDVSPNLTLQMPQ